MSDPAEQLTIFTAPGCVWCSRAKEWLEQQGVPFQERDVSTDQQAAADMVRISGQYGVPVITSNGEVVIGFDRDRLEDMIQRKGRREKRPSLGLLARDAPGSVVEVGGARSGSRAERAGFQKGDVLVELHGEAVQSMQQLEELLARTPQSSAITAKVRRGENEVELTIPS